MAASSSACSLSPSLICWDTFARQANRQTDKRRRLTISALCASCRSSPQVVDSSPSPRGTEEGLCFSDGKRKVDYVLVFHQRRHGSIRCPASTSASHDRLSIVSNGNFPTAVGSDVDQGRGGVPGVEAPSVGEVFVELGGNEATEPADHEIHLIRQEFEASLAEAGLEVERESEVSARARHPSCPWIDGHQLHVQFSILFSVCVQAHLWASAKAWG